MCGLKRRIVPGLFFSLALLTTLAGCGNELVVAPPEATYAVTAEPLTTLELGFSFPPVRDEQQRAFTATQLEALNVRLIRFAEDWGFREPSPGQFNWQPLDDRIAWAEEHQVSLLLTIQSDGPEWACDPELRNPRSCVFNDAGAFAGYVAELLQRYPDQIEKIQFGNEWPAEYWYVGSAEEFVRFHNLMYQAVQQYSPQTRVVLGGFSHGTLQMIALCEGYVESVEVWQDAQVVELNRQVCESSEAQAARRRIMYVLENANYDWLDLHFYDHVEAWPAILQTVLETFPQQRPILVSEFGGPNLFLEQPYSDTFQAERLVEYIRTLDEMGIREAYFFKLVQGDDASPAHRESGLFEVQFGTMVPKPAYDVFAAYSTSRDR
jgi:hypothetical protein